MDDLVKRLTEGRTTGSNLRWTVTDIHREAAVALTEAQATIARLEAALEFYAPKEVDGIKFAGGDDAGQRARAALSPGKGG
jgi:hypothetical protein